MMTKARLIIKFETLLALVLLTAACQLATPVANVAPETVQGIDRIAFTGIQPASELTSAPKSSDLAEMNKLIVDLLAKYNYTPIPPGQIRGTRASILSQGAESNPSALIKKIAQAQGADAILTGELYRYREKMTGGDPPASVGLLLRLVRVSDERVLWRGRFDETQVSVFENLLNLPKFFRRGLRWISARELSLDGITQMMKTFPPHPDKT